MIKALDSIIPIVDIDGVMKQQFRSFVLQVSNESIVIGTGSPEGVIEAQQGRQYMDDSGSTGSILYIKKQADIGGDKSQGWILV